MIAEELDELYNFCDKHSKLKQTNPGTYGECLHCSALAMNFALSQIDTLINPIGNKEYGYISLFDLDCSLAGVVERVKAFIKNKSKE